MKEVTEWNGKPRWMWCWDSNESNKTKSYVVHILSKEEMKEAGTNLTVITVYSDYEHCAEIEEETTRLTYYELSQLLKCFGVEVNYYYATTYCNTWSYINDAENKELPEGYKIRYKQGEWEEPTRETVWKWWGEETPNSDIARFISFIGWDEDNKE